MDSSEKETPSLKSSLRSVTWGTLFVVPVVGALVVWLAYVGFTQGWPKLGLLLIGGHGQGGITYSAGVKGLARLDIMVPLLSAFLFSMLAARCLLLVLQADKFRVPKQGGLLFYMLVGLPTHGYSARWELVMLACAAWVAAHSSTNPLLNAAFLAAGVATAVFMGGEFLFYKHVKRWYMTPEEVAQYNAGE